VLSVNGSNLDVAEALHCPVVVIPDYGEGLDTLDRSVAHLEWIGRPYIVDPVIEPITSGFAASLDRYVTVRARYPDAEMFMGIGNITELTDADTTGVNALLIGFCQELGIRHVLDRGDSLGARRRARGRRGPTAHARGPAAWRHPQAHRRQPAHREGRPAEHWSEAALRALHAAITDPNFRIHTPREAIYVFNCSAPRRVPVLRGYALPAWYP
jgi:hypothetical protein